MADLPLRLIILLPCVLVLLLISNLLAIIGLLVGLCFIVGIPVLIPRSHINRVKRNAQQHRDALYAQFLEATRQWEAHMVAHEHNERYRRQSQQLWFPLRPYSGPSRVDIFGGTSDGWASLLATLGSSLLSTEKDVLVLDFSEHEVADGLVMFAEDINIPVNDIDIPSSTASSNPLNGIPTHELVELIAETIHTMRPQPDPIDMRALDAELVGAVAERLAAPLSFTRLVAGLKVLRRTYDVRAEDGPLSSTEIRELTTIIDTVGHTERAQQELQFLTGLLDLVAKEEVTPAENSSSSSTLWDSAGLTVISTRSPHQRRKDFIDRLLIHRLLYEFRNDHVPGRRGVLVVAGADHIGLPTLESLAKQARRVGVQIVLLLEHLRGDLTQLLGGSDSATILMRLGNAQEATSAAEFIGRGHKFVLSQITKQVGTSFTDGTSESYSLQIGTSDTTGDNRSDNYTKGANFSPKRQGDQVVLGTGQDKSKSKSKSFSIGTSNSLTESRSRSWQSTTNYSVADSTSDSDTQARVYEFAVEPTEIQSLPHTAFILIEPNPSGRRVVLADCNPGITLLERVANEPRRQ